MARVAETLDVSAVPRDRRRAASRRVDDGVDAGDLGKVITVFSTKGGAGKSVLAANLAVVLARRSPTSRSCWSTPTCSSATSP